MWVSLSTSSIRPVFARLRSSTTATLVPASHQRVALLIGPAPVAAAARVHTCNIRRLIRRLCSAVNRISAKTNSSRSSQAICSR